MVVLAAFFQSALVFGVLRSFGVFFVEFVAAFEEQAARVSWITSIGIAVQQFGSPVGSALSTKFGPRPVVMAGAILAALGMLLASFATSLTHLYLSIGLLSGYLRDVTGNYTASFVVAGAFLLAGSGVLITLPHFCSSSTSKSQDLVIEALDTKIPLPKEGLGED